MGGTTGGEELSSVLFGCACGRWGRKRVCAQVAADQGRGPHCVFAVRLLSKMGLHMYTRLTDSVNAGVHGPVRVRGCVVEGQGFSPR